MTRIFHWLFMWKMDPMSGFHIRLVFTLPLSDSTLQYERCVHLWNNFPCIKSLVHTDYGKSLVHTDYGKSWQYIKWIISFTRDHCHMSSYISKCFRWSLKLFTISHVKWNTLHSVYFPLKYYCTRWCGGRVGDWSWNISIFYKSVA